MSIVAKAKNQKRLPLATTFFFSFICIMFCLGLNAYTISSDHPRLLVTPADIPRIRNEYIVDGDMNDVDCAMWENQSTPTLKEKISFDGDQRLHISGPNGSGARQYLFFEPGVEYEYSVDVYIVSGTCSGQLYQSGNSKTMFVSSTAGQWQTFAGTFIPNEDLFCLRFRSLILDAEFYIDNVSFKPTYQRISDRDMEAIDCSDWLNEGSPTTKEKYDFDGSKRLHVVGDVGTGAKQSLLSKPGVEYEYSVDVYIVSGTCSGQLKIYDVP